MRLLKELGPVYGKLLYTGQIKLKVSEWLDASSR